jgi:hypothetical protein
MSAAAADGKSAGIAATASAGGAASPVVVSATELRWSALWSDPPLSSSQLNGALSQLHVEAFIRN